MKPLPFQIEDRDFLLQGDRANWSEPGTGKTLGAALALAEVGGNAAIVAPASAVDQWVRVLRSLDVDAVAARDGTEKGAARVTSWGMFGRGIFSEGNVDVFIPDEAHKAVSATAQRTRAALDLIERSDRVWPLTGTPMIRYADGLWPLCEALWPGHLEALGVRSQMKFEKRFCLFRDGVIAGTRQSTLRTLHKALYDGIGPWPRVVSRRTMAEVSPFMPKMLTRQLTIRLSARERAEIDAELGPEMMELLEMAQGVVDDEDGHVASARRALGLLKAPEAAAYVAEAPGKVIACYWHAVVGDVLEERLTALGRSVVRLDGSVLPTKRQPIIDEFNRPDGPDVFVLQMQAGGEAVNPHEHCSHLVFCERDWSAAIMDQAMRRVRRIGQGRPQQLDFFDAEHPLEDAIRSVSGRKLRDMGVLQGER